MAYNPTVNPQSLSQLSSVPLYATLDAARWLREGQQADAQGLADLPQQYAHQQAMRLLQREQARLGNETTLAQLPGVQADSSMRQRKNTMEEFVFDDAKKAAVAKLAADLSGDEIKAIENQAQKLMYGTPEERKRGQAMLMASKEMMMLKAKSDAELELQRLKNAGGVERAQVSGAGRGGAKPRDFLKALDGVKSAVQKGAALRGEIARLRVSEPDSQLVDVYESMLEALAPSEMAERTDAARRAGGGMVQGPDGKWRPYTPAAVPTGAPKKAEPAQFDADKEKRYQEWVKKQQGGQ